MKHIGVFSVLIPVLSVMSRGEYFTQHSVVTGFWAPAGISVCDMNGDERPDILAAAWNDDEIAFWINSGEPTPQWEEHTVEESLDGAAFCDGGDLNGDGLIDIAACGFYAEAVMIYLADGNDGWTVYQLCDDLADAHEVHLTDINGDGLLDCVAAAGGNCSIASWLNDGSTPDSWDRHDVCLGMEGGRSVCFGDFDEDGDVDMAGCALVCDDIRWWENSGEAVPEWTEHQIENYFNGSHMIRACDMNCDGFTDLICTAFGNGRTGVWYNSGTVPVEWDKQLLAGSFGLALGVEAVDINGDGLPDLAGTSMNPDQLAIWINNGDLPSTWEKTVVDDYLLDGWPLGSGDFNGDGRQDLTAGGNGAGYIRWYENMPGTGIFHGEEDLSLALSFPNPSHSGVQVRVNLPAPCDLSLSIMDIAGREVRFLHGGSSPGGWSEHFWDGSSSDGTICGEGVYLIRAENSNGDLIVEKVTLLK